MAVLGKSLVFYFKYWTEMARLCESEEAELEGLPEPDRMREMAQQVGVKAGKQAADFLEECAGGLESHFNQIGKCKKITSRRVVERNWSVSYGFWITRRPAKFKLEVGINIVRLEKPEIIPWMWRFGGKDAEDTLAQILKDRVKAKSHDLGLKLGSVALDRIQVLPGDINGFDIDREPLVEKVSESFKVVIPQDIRFLLP